MTKTCKNKNGAVSSNREPSHGAAPFEIKELHTKALLTLLHCHHNNRETLTYAELSTRIETGEKTKNWQLGAWKELKSNEYIVPSSSDKKSFELSAKGVELASTLASDEELAEFKAPETTKELHNKIKAKLERNAKGKRYAARILDLMAAPDYTPLNRHEMAAKFNVVADSHGFTYGLKALREPGYVVHCTASEIAEIKAAAAAKPQPEMDVAVNQEKAEEASGESVPVDEKKRALDESGKSNEPPKKKKYKSTKKRSGGKPLKLSDKAFILPSAVTPDSKKSM